MTADPIEVTITTESEDGAIQYAIARAEAAKRFGVKPGRVVICVGNGPVTITPASAIVDPDTKLPVRPARFTVTSRWQPVDRDPPRPDPEKLPWPDVRLPRGARWHGLVPQPEGEPVEAILISTGDKLVWPDSDEGKAVLAAMK